MKKQPTVEIKSESIVFQNRDLWLDQRIQETPLGKEIRYSGIRVNEEMPNKYGKRHWIYTFIYLDGSGLIEFEIDYNDNVRKRKADKD